MVVFLSLKATILRPLWTTHMSLFIKTVLLHNNTDRIRWTLISRQPVKHQFYWNESEKIGFILSLFI